MGYDFKIKNWCKIKDKQKTYPWPCKSQPERKIELFDDDILTKEKNGRYIKHTGLCCCNIIIPDEDLIHQNQAIRLKIN